MDIIKMVLRIPMALVWSIAALVGYVMVEDFTFKEFVEGFVDFVKKGI